VGSAVVSFTVHNGSIAQARGVALRPFTSYWGNNIEAMNGDFADMKAGGITWARIDLYQTEAHDPAFDAAVSAAASHGIRLLVTVRKNRPDKDIGTDTERATYRSWLASMVNRYSYYVKHWEIHNEPNLHYEWNIDESPDSDQSEFVASVQRYIALLHDSHDTIKAADPASTVLFGGLSECWVERYLDVLITTDAYRYFDVMSFHPYGSNPGHAVSRFNAVQGKLSLDVNYASKPIWITEVGFNTSWPNKAGYVASEQQKADYLVGTIHQLLSAGARLPVFWYTLHENEDAGGYGLTLKDKSTPQTQFFPAYYAYRDLRFSGDLRTGTDRFDSGW
jgi:hypothetical protein